MGFPAPELSPRHAPEKARSAHWIDLLATGWLAAVTAIFCAICVYTLFHPWNGGRERWWAVTWVVVLLGAAVLTRVLRPRALLLFVSIGTLLAGLVMLAGARRLDEAGVVLLVLLVANALGTLIVRPGEPPHWALLLSLRLATGLALLALATLGVGLVGLLSRKFLWAMLIVATLLLLRTIGHGLRAAVDFAAAATTSFGDWPAIDRWLFTVMPFPLLVVFSWGVAPDLQFDALNYQLTVPGAYLRAGRIVDMPYLWHSYFSHLTNFLFALGLGLRGQGAVKLFLVAFGVITAMATMGIGAAIGRRRAGLWAAAIFFAVPIVADGCSTAHVDVATAMFLASAYGAFLLWVKEPDRRWLLAACGIMAGAAVATKVIGTFGVAGLVLAIAWQLRREPPRRIAVSTVVFAAPFLILAVPAYAIVYHFTGNPFFPLLNGIFRSPRWEARNDLMNLGMFGLGRSPAALLRLPFEFTFHTTRFGEGLRPGAAGPALALVPMVLLHFVRRQETFVLLTIASVIHVALWSFSAQYGRYAITFLPLLLVLIVAGAETAAPRATQLLLATCLAAEVLVTPILFWHIPDRFPIRFALGRQTEKEFLERSLRGYSATEFLNGVLRKDEAVFTEGGDPLRYYIQAPVASYTETFDIRRIVEGNARGDFAKALLRQHYRYLLLPDDKASAFLSEHELWRWARLRFASDGFYVYELSSRPIPPAPVFANLLDDPGFEQVCAPGSRWVCFGTAKTSETNPHSGRRAALADSSNNFTQTVAVRPREIYTLGQFNRADSGGQQARLQVNWLSRDGETLGTTIRVVDVGTFWQWSDVSATAPESAAQAAIYIGEHGNSSVWFDDVWFSRGASTPESLRVREAGQ